MTVQPTGSAHGPDTGSYEVIHLAGTPVGSSFSGWRRLPPRDTGGGRRPPPLIGWSM